jgi:hypothetical protein
VNFESIQDCEVLWRDASVGEGVVVVAAAAAAAAAAAKARLTQQIVGELGTLPQKPSKKVLACITLLMLRLPRRKANCVQFTKREADHRKMVLGVGSLSRHVAERRLIYTLVE